MEAGGLLVTLTCHSLTEEVIQSWALGIFRFQTSHTFFTHHAMLMDATHHLSYRKATLGALSTKNVSAATICFLCKQ